MKNFVYRADTLIIGNTLSAFLHSYIYNIPLIYNRNNNNSPFPFEFYEKERSLDRFCIPYEKNDFVMPNDKIKSYGIQKIDLYERLGAVLFLAGNIYFGDKLESIFISDDKETVEVTTSDIQKYNVKYKKLLIFDINKINNLNMNFIKKEEKRFLVADWWNIRHMEPHSYDLLETEDEFIKQIFFFPSERTDGNVPIRRLIIRKDCVAVSYLTEKQLSDINWNETISSLKTRNIMKSFGLKGSKLGFWHKKPNYQQRKSLKIELDKREIRQINQDIICENIDNIEFHHEDDLSLVNFYNTFDHNITLYPYVLNTILFRKWQHHVRTNERERYKTFLSCRNRASAQAGEI